MPNYLVHKAVDLSKVKKGKRALLTDDYLNQNYLAQPKHDGVCGVVKSGELLSRTGETCVAFPLIVQDVTHSMSDLVVFGEVWHPRFEQSEISGEFRSHRRGSDSMRLIVFDAVPLDKYEAGYDPASYVARHERILDRYRAQIKEYGPDFIAWEPVRNYNQGTYGRHTALRDIYLKQGGYDGLILRDPLAAWCKGNGTGGEIIKDKCVLSFDLEVVGVTEGQGKFSGAAGTLTLRWKDGKTIKAGGLDMATRQDWLSDPGAIIGKIVEVEAMGYSTDGLLREPRIKGVRFDKEKADF